MFVRKAILTVSTLFLFILSLPTTAETIGGDVYAGGADASISGGSSRNAFVAGFSVTLDGEVAGDGHAAGFDVDVEGSSGGDLYAAGASVSVDGKVGRDLTASGFTVRLRKGANVAGNARIAGGSVRILAPIEGSLVVTAGRLEINAPVSGDASLTAAEISFGDDAKINGNLSYSAPSRIAIPASVIDPEKVTFTQITRPEAFKGLREGFGEGWSPWPSFFAILFAFVLSIVFLTLIGAVLLAVIPGTVEAARERASNRAGMSLLAGFFGLAMLIGLVPVSGMTIIGIPFIPIAVLLIAAVWIVSYLLGVYAISLRIAGAFDTVPATNLARLIVLAAGLVAFAILNFIPFLGWLINLAVVLLGLGAIAALIAGRLLGGSVDGEAPTEAAAVEDGAKGEA